MIECDSPVGVIDRDISFALSGRDSASGYEEEHLISFEKSAGGVVGVFERSGESFCRRWKVDDFSFDDGARRVSRPPSEDGWFSSLVASAVKDAYFGGSELHYSIQISCFQSNVP